ncbi:MAG: HAMP domain-containing protein [Methyloprofundus sp.]|nr:HAMP domain-containing protein [Methyloprofundus sp.]
MKKTKKENLQRTMMMYFLLIVSATLLVTTEFVLDAQSTDLHDSLLSNFQHFSDQEMTKEQVFVPLEKLRNQAILMIAIIMYVTIIVLMMLMKNITGPLQHMIEMSEKISEGDLTQSISIDSGNELAQLGGVINEMSSNIQEVTLLSQNMSSNGGVCIDNVRKLLASGEITDAAKAEILTELEQLQMDFEMLKDFTDCFNLFELDSE